MTIRHRDVAQLGSALPWGGRGRQFKSDRSDQLNKTRLTSFFLLLTRTILQKKNSNIQTVIILIEL